MNRRGGLGMIIFIACIVLLVAIILLVILLHGKEEPKKLAPSNVTVNKTFYNMTIGSNALTNVFYVLQNSSNVLVQGTLFPNALEGYNGGVPANTTVKLSAWSDKYYYYQVTCNITKEKFPCQIGLKEKALNYSLNLTTTALTIEPYEKIIQAPITVCFTESQNIANVLVSLPDVQKPQDLRWVTDLCFLIKQDIVTRMVYPLTLHLNQIYNSSGNLSVLVRDHEQDGYANIGDKNATAVVS